MSMEQATTFDQEAKETLLRTYNNGIIPLRVATSIVWGIPPGEMKP